MIFVSTWGIFVYNSSLCFCNLPQQYLSSFAWLLFIPSPLDLTQNTPRAVMASSATQVEIPSPKSLPILGNSWDVDPHNSLASLLHLADIYGEKHFSRGSFWFSANFTSGPIFKLSLAGTDRVYVSSYELLNEICDETRFEKAVTGALWQLRDAMHDGLITAISGQHDWTIGHRVLMPAFGPIAIQNMFDGMKETS
jgi:cytochrome P450/NADPH-cytochrome P450 reductase